VKFFNPLLAVVLSLAIVFALPAPQALASSFAVPIFNTPARFLALDSVVFQKTSYPNHDSNLDVSGSYPVVSGIPDAGFQAAVNKRIKDAYQGEIDAARLSRALSLSFYYEVKPYDPYYSVVFYFMIVGSSAKNKVDCVVFDIQRGDFATINDCLGPNGVQIVNYAIAKAILSNPDKYNLDSAVIDNSQTFYIDSGEVHIPFANFEFVVDIASVTSYTLKSGSYSVKNSYSINMVPLREVCEGLNYSVGWNISEKSAEVAKEGFSSKLTIDKNAYTKSRSETKLECPPELTEGQTFVPISYFEEVLGAFYTVSDDGSITFSVYEPAD